MDATDWFNPRLFMDDDAVFRLAEGPPGAPRLFIIDDFLSRDSLSGLLPLFSEDSAWHDSYGLFKPDHAGQPSGEVSEEEWSAATPARRFWFNRVAKNDLLRQTMTVARAHFFQLTQRGLVDPILVRRLEARTGLHLESSLILSRAIIGGRGHFQAPHSDAGRNRRLCGALYLSDGWRPGYGGEFDMMIGYSVVHTVAPKANRIVLFDPRERIGASSQNTGYGRCWRPPETGSGGAFPFGGRRRLARRTSFHNHTKHAISAKFFATG